MLRFPSLIARIWTLTLVSLAIGALVPGCARDTVLDAEDYDQTCTTAEDCTDVLVGDMCTCGCTYGAISKSALDELQADDAAARRSCGETGINCFPCDESPPLICNSGTCGFAE
jgi:hypothetical protein